MGTDRPIFVAGAGRSGKTLVRWMLSAHPRIVVTRRTDLWPRFFGRYGDLADEANLERCVAAMTARKQVADLGIDAERLVRELQGGERTYPRLFALLHEQVAEGSGKQRWGDQSATIEAFADDVLAAYAGATFIHLIRDPRDRFVAELERSPRRRLGDVGRSVAHWRRSARLAEGNRARHGDAYLIVRYESLVTRPEETTRELCASLGETFDPAMLRLEDAERYRDVRDASPTGSAITDAFVGRYRTYLPARDVAFIQRTAEHEMQTFGYGIDDVELSLGQRVRAAATRPANVAAMRDRGDEARSGGSPAPRRAEVPG